jgi:lipopolysaccharide transport system permease protein
MISIFYSAIGYRHAIKSMVIKDLKDKYVDSRLGALWAVINPILTILAVNFVFTKIMKTDIRYYPVMVLSALLPWIFFSNSISEAATSMRKNSGMLGQFTIPRDLIPLSVVLSNLTVFLLGFFIMMPLFIIVNAGIARYLFLIPLLIFLHMIFTLGVSVLFSVVNIYFKDLSQLLNIGLMFLFWMTPIFYPIGMIPEDYQWIIFANPGACYIVIYRSLLYEGSAGSPHMWFAATAFALIALIAGYSIFVKKEQDILKNI